MTPYAQHDAPAYGFTVFVDSRMPRSTVAVERLRSLCAAHLLDDYTLEVIDLLADPGRFERDRVLVVPTLIVNTPTAPERRFVGDLSLSDTFVMALGMGRSAVQMAREARRMRERLRRELADLAQQEGGAATQESQQDDKG